MYICENCGEFFEEPNKVRSETCRVDGIPFYETDRLCPYCGDDHIVTTKQYNPFRGINSAMEEVI